MQHPAWREEREGLIARPSSFVEKTAVNSLGNHSKFTCAKSGSRVCRAVGLFLLAGSLVFAMPLSAAETGIRGTALWGPVKPGPSRPGRGDEAPLKATFHVRQDGNEVAQFRSGKAGRFEVMLPPGEYVIVPDRSTPIPMPESQWTSVTVPEDGFADVTLRLDTGMR